MSSPRSFVDSFFDGKESRYNPKMSPDIPRSKWRKGSQWIALIRKHADLIVDDDVILPVFKTYCKRRPPIELSKGRKNIVSDVSPWFLIYPISLHFDAILIAVVLHSALLVKKNLRGNWA
ncbi:Glycosyltransferase bc10 [Thalictrum thalictroides]|uniref:Glycosyltransferase bc10 n=1 Tax=Thalictrum thalictroides TaxID=46969 RepID=A0A7J6X353_THATH|nr:Glycosyltransferase bc10 [Thalictrum thalictroides]